MTFESIVYFIFYFQLFCLQLYWKLLTVVLTQLQLLCSNVCHSCTSLVNSHLSQDHTLHGSTSIVLMATGQVNGRWRILTPTESPLS